MQSLRILMRVVAVLAGISLIVACERSTELTSANDRLDTGGTALTRMTGNKIAFASFESQQNPHSDIFIMEMDGSNLTNVTSKLGDSYMPSFSPDGSKLTFVCNGEIYLMDCDGGNARRLTANSSAMYKSFPIFSPDGTQIAFFAKTGDYTSKLDIYVVNTDGSHLTRLTHQEAESLYPCYSPDGLKIVYWAGLTTNEEKYYTDIFVMDASGNGKLNLTPNAGYNCFPRYSPDGTKIVFISQRAGDQEYALYLMNAEGSNQHRIFASNRMVTFPQFTPDGAKIVFLLYTASTNQSDTDICIIDASGANFKNLTNSAYRDWGPVVAKDGTSMVFESDRDGNDEIYVMNIDGSNPTRLTNRPNRVDFQPTFQFHE